MTSALKTFYFFRIIGGTVLTSHIWGIVRATDELDSVCTVPSLTSYSFLAPGSNVDMTKKKPTLTVSRSKTGEFKYSLHRSFNRQNLWVISFEEDTILLGFSLFVFLYNKLYLILSNLLKCPVWRCLGMSKKELLLMLLTSVKSRWWCWPPRLTEGVSWIFVMYRVALSIKKDLVLKKLLDLIKSVEEIKPGATWIAFCWQLVSGELSSVFADWRGPMKKWMPWEKSTEESWLCLVLWSLNFLQTL